MAATVSVSVLIRDEIEMLPYAMPCYASLDNILREVVFVDDGSTDGSKEKAFEIASQFKHLPIVWIENPMRRWDEQRNIGLDACTGDYIVSIDADMGFTGNLRTLIESGHFDKFDVWDFRMFYSRGDLFHHDWRSYDCFNRTTRLIKNSGVRYSGVAHEQPDVYSGPNKTAVASVKDGERPAKGFCPEVHILHMSALGSDESQWERGRRLVDRWSKEMTERGISPGTPDRYILYKYNDNPIREIVEPDKSMIVTMEDALRHWGK